MQAAVIDILGALREGLVLDKAELDRIIRRNSKRLHDGRRKMAKKHILGYYLQVKRDDPVLFATWNVDDKLDSAFIDALRMKPRRTASGVATVTVITKPWPCSSNCIYCPCDIRMPKSYLSDEPACQRAERNYFDPYLQVASRVRSLQNMGHAVEKIELIVLGGTWTDYPEDYRLWFMRELFRCLNDEPETREENANRRLCAYRDLGLHSDAVELAREAESLQQLVNAHAVNYNEAWTKLYAESLRWSQASSWQHASWEDLELEHARNESAVNRVVGLVVETRPDALSVASLAQLRRMGATKIQMGIQSLDDALLKLNGRSCTAFQVAQAFKLARLFGFKTHAHFMLNLLGATPDSDKSDYAKLVGDSAYLPDEVKLYPCALVGGTELVSRYAQGDWRPYTEEELVDVLVYDLVQTPRFTRVSRMIRDISASDILVGNKKTNLRQIVEGALGDLRGEVCEIRFREVADAPVDLQELVCEDTCYETGATVEHFLEWVTPDNRIVGFLRLSLPSHDAVSRIPGLPVKPDEAMIREVHVYGFAAKLDSDAVQGQHHGLGKALVSRARLIAREAGYARINVISSIGTREYYRKLGFADNGLYQTADL